MNRDPQFGHIIMFGLGGILVEAIKDVSFRVAPVNNSSAENMIRETKAFRLLQGFRGMPARDIARLQDCIQRLSQLVCDFPMLEEIDINPLLVHEEGKGVSVIDARLLLSS
jgi:acetyltransferase